MQRGPLLFCSSRPAVATSGPKRLASCCAMSLEHASGTNEADDVSCRVGRDTQDQTVRACLIRLTHIQLTRLVIMLCALCSGCRFADVLVQTTVVEPLGYARGLEERRERIRFRHLAECALVAEKARVRAELDDYECEPFSVDEQCGFLDGFADYLDAGGNGNPPPLPPRRYWRTEHENPDGYQAMQDWYRGYAQGAAAAQASGYRELVTICTSDSLGAFREPHYPGQDRCLVGPPFEVPPVDEPKVDEPSRLVIHPPDEPVQLRLADRDAATESADPPIETDAPLTLLPRWQPPRGDDPQLESGVAIVAPTLPQIPPPPVATPQASPPQLPDALEPQPPGGASHLQPQSEPSTFVPSLPLGLDASAPQPPDSDSRQQPTLRTSGITARTLFPAPLLPTPHVNFSMPTPPAEGGPSAGFDAWRPDGLEPPAALPVRPKSEIAESTPVATASVWPPPYRAPPRPGEPVTQSCTPGTYSQPEPILLQRLPATARDVPQTSAQQPAPVVRLPQGGARHEG